MSHESNKDYFSRELLRLIMMEKDAAGRYIHTQDGAQLIVKSSVDAIIKSTKVKTLNQNKGNLAGVFPALDALTAKLGINNTVQDIGKYLTYENDDQKAG